MNWNTVALATIGAFNLGMSGLKYVANKHEKKNAMLKAIENRGEEAAEAFVEAKKRCDIYKACAEKEKKAFNAQLKDWKLSHDFESRKQDILDTISEGLYEFKEQIGYSEKVDELDDAFNAGIASFKASIDYDGSKSKFQKEINEAKHQYEQKKALFDASSTDISDTAMKLRHAEEEAMTVKVKEATSQIEALENQLKEETEKCAKKKQEGLRELEEKVSKEKIRLDKKADKDMEKLNEELTKAQDDIHKKIRKGRTEEEKAAFISHDEDISLIREQHEIDDKLAKKIFDEMPVEARFGGYLKDHKVPKFVVVSVASLPAIPVGYLAYKYVGFVAKVVKAM